MYNYYSYNKEQIANRSERKRKEREAASQEKYKLQQKKMISNHQTRVKKFVLELVKNPLIIQDVTIHDNILYKSAKGASMKKSTSKKFEFGQFVTDRERIKKLIEAQKEDSKKVTKYTMMNNKANKIIYEQPKMRFKHRTQLERIVDQLNQYNYNEKNNDILKRQIRKLKLDAVKKPKRKLNYSYETISSDNEDTSVDNCVSGKIGQYRNKLIEEKELLSNNFVKRKEANMSMRELMKEYNFHTYFKTAKQIIDFKAIKQDFHKSLPFSKSIESDRKSKNHIKLQKHLTRNLTRDIQDNSNDINSVKKRMENEIIKQLSLNKAFISNLTSKYSTANINNIEFVNNNPFLYKISADQKTQNISVPCSPTFKEYLYKISRKPSLIPTPKRRYFVSFECSGEDASLKGKSSFEQIQDIGDGEHDKVKIDNEIISVNQMDVITKKMLKKCNFVRSKSTCNNTNLKKGSGKLMITAGLSIEEFSKKFNV